MKFNSLENSKGDDLDGSWYINWAVFVVSVNWNSINRKWNVNAWNLDNEWDAGDRFFLKTPKVSLLVYPGEFLPKIPFFQPPTIRPSSRICSDSIKYFLLSIAFISHKILRKNLSASIFLIVVSRIDSLFWLHS